MTQVKRTMDQSSTGQQAAEKITCPPGASLLELARYYRALNLNKTQEAKTNVIPLRPKEAATSNKESLTLAHEELKKLVGQLNAPDDYRKIRDEYQKLEYALNEQGLWAPAFRPSPKIPFKSAELLPVHELILQDRIVIDCHWLHLHGGKLRPKEVNWHPMFDKKRPFPWEMAKDFSERKISSEIRANEALSLTGFQQIQLRSIRNHIVRNQFDIVEKSSKSSGKRVPSIMETATLVVNRWCEQDRRMEPHREKYLALARANALLAHTFPTWSEIARLTGLIQGVPTLSERTIRDLSKKLSAKTEKLAAR